MRRFWLLAMLTLTAGFAQAQLPVFAPPPDAAPVQDHPTPFKPEVIEALVAPVALYPDSVLAQVLMASTYPLEIVHASALGQG